MASLTLDTLRPDARDAVTLLLARAREMGLTVSVRSTVRTCAEQNAIYAQGRTAPGDIVTHARGCQSWHVWGRAVDFTITKGTEANYRELGMYWRTLGGKWGGDFGDISHYEWHPGLKVEEVCLDPDACTMNRAKNEPYLQGNLPVEPPPGELPPDEPPTEIASTSWWPPLLLAAGALGALWYVSRPGMRS